MILHNLLLLENCKKSYWWSLLHLTNLTTFQVHFRTEKRDWLTFWTCALLNIGLKKHTKTCMSWQCKMFAAVVLIPEASAVTYSVYNSESTTNHTHTHTSVFADTLVQHWVFFELLIQSKKELVYIIFYLTWFKLAAYFAKIGLATWKSKMEI